MAWKLLVPSVDELVETAQLLGGFVPWLCSHSRRRNRLSIQLVDDPSLIGNEFTGP